jgi:hypothetical protein
MGRLVRFLRERLGFDVLAFVPDVNCRSHPSEGA